MLKKVENLDIVFGIIKSPELTEKRIEFMEKFSVNSDSIFIFNSNLSKWLKGEIDIRKFVDNIAQSNIDFDIENYSIFDVLYTYLKTHLDPIAEYIEEDPEKVIETAIKIQESYLTTDLNIGSKKNTPELFDDIYESLDNPEDIITEVTNVLGVKFSNKEFRERYYNVCVKFFKNIRNKFESIDILVKAKKDNGVGMDKELAEKVLTKIESIKKQFENEVLEEKRRTIEPQKTFQETEKIDDLDIDEEDKVNNTRLNNIEKTAKVISESITEDGKKYYVLDSSIEEMYLNQIKNKEDISNTGNSSLNKAKKDIKLIGPIEELEFFTIKDFRNLSQNVEKRVEIIEYKVKVLSSYSARKRILGIKAWLMCEVCSVYKKMIDESVKYGNMNRVINNRRDNGELYLTQEEIDAISQLNRRLRI